MDHRGWTWLVLSALVTGAAQADAPVIVLSETTRQAGLIEPLAGIMGHGGAWGDFDGDGWIDLFVGGFCDRPNEEYRPAPGPVGNRLFRNLGNGRFQRVRDLAVECLGRTSGAVFADLENKGALDLYVAHNAMTNRRAGEPQGRASQQRCQLFRNEGGRFADVSAASRACPENLYKARNVGVLDIDADGLLDLLVVEDRFTPRPRSVLLRNCGKLRFEDANATVGLPEGLFGFGLAIADLNGDGRPDFFMPHSNRLFLSVPGGKYREAGELREVFAWKPLHSEDWPCGAAFGDLNRDGRLDLVVSIHSEPARNRVYLNQGLKDGVPLFRDVTEAVGLGTPVPVRCPHVEIQDFDNDGWPDLFISAAWLDGGDRVTPLVYRNTTRREGLPQFVPPRPIGGPMVYYPAAPSGDYDRDGRLDLFLVNWFQGNHCRLLHNESRPRHWLDVSVVGRTMNRMGVGASVRLYKAGQPHSNASLLGYQEIATGYGYASGQPAVCHFGLGDEAKADVEVTLPDGKAISQPNVAADQALVVREP